MMSALPERLIQWRWPLFALSILITVCAFMGFKQFVFDASPRSYFVDGHAPYERFVALEETYGRDFRVFIMLTAKEGDLFTPDHAKALLDATEQAWKLPFVRRVDSIANYQFTSSQDDELYVEDFLSEGMLDKPEKLIERKQTAVNDIAVVNRLISDDAKHAGIILSLTVDGSDSEGEEDLVNKAYALEEEIKSQHPTIDVAITGNLVSTYHSRAIASRDIAIMVPTMFLLMFILIGALLRSISTVFVALFVAMFAGIGALGLGALFGVEFSMLAINALIISITVAVAHCIHIFTQFFTELKTKPKREALADSIRVNFFAVSMTSLTTAIGFLSLNFNDLPPAIALGNAAAIGTGLAWLYSLTILPALVMLLPFSPPKAESQFLTHRMANLAEFVIAHQYKLLIGMSALTAIMIALSFSNILNDRFSEIIHEPHIFRSDTNAVDQHFGSLYSAHYDLDAGSADNIADPEYLKKMDEFAEFLRAQPEVKSVYSFADVIKRLNKSMHNDDPAYYKIPDSRELTAQYILLYEMSLPFGLDLNDQITMDKQRSRLLATMPAIDTRQLKDIEERVWAWQQENLPQQMQHEGASMAIIWAHLSENSLTNSLKGSVIALTLISLILLLVLKSLRYGLVSLAPNLLPASFGFGAWYFMSGEVGIGLTCVIIITIGIVVDDTVHFLAKYKKAMDENNQNSAQAIRTTFRQVGPALCITTMVLSAGFLVLALSKISGNSSLGSVTAIILFAALILDLLLLPALLLLIDKKRKMNQPLKQ